MRMTSALSNLLLASAIMGGTETPRYEGRRNVLPDSGNYKRKHKENVKRKRLRRITKKSISINRK